MKERFHIRHILFPTDFSKSSESAALHVAGLAKLLSAKVTVLNVLPRLSGWDGASEPHFAVGDDVSGRRNARAVPISDRNIQRRNGANSSADHWRSTSWNDQWSTAPNEC